MLKYLIVGLLVVLASSAYEPELLLTVKPQFLNKFIANYSDLIIHTLNNYSIPDPAPFEEKVSGVKISVNLTHLKQKVEINWSTNILSVKDKHSFALSSKNINVTLDAQVEAKVGLVKQKGTLKVTITQLGSNITLAFQNAKCPKSIGFDVQVKDALVDASNITIKMEGKSLDNAVINLIEKYLKPRIPAMLQNAIQTQLNPLISKYTCNRIEEELAFNDQYYLIVMNTTEVPVFNDDLRYLRCLVDLTLQNIVTNETNDQLERDDLPGNPSLALNFDLSLAASSNFLNTVVWLVGDSQLLSINVNNSMLGDNPPILLNTTNLSILLPNIKTKEWANKEVVLMIKPSTKFEHLLVRSGRIMTVMSLSVKFVVNVTGTTPNVTDCLVRKDCVTACDLNITLPLSLSLQMNKTDLLGFIQSVALHQIEVIKSEIEVNVGSLKSILNSIVGSMIPSANKELVGGQPVPEALYNITEQYKISELQMRTDLDYLTLGCTIDL